MEEPLGLLLIVFSIPMILRWVPQNPIYGLRIPATCNNKSVWYDANALSGRHLLFLGLALVALDYMLSLFSLSRATRREIYWLISVVGILGVLFADWRTANRWAREREAKS